MRYGKPVMIGCALLALVIGATAHSANFAAGAGKADIAIPDAIYPIDGFNGEHDPLQTRVLILQTASTRVALAVIDLTSLSEDSIAAARAIIARIAKVAPGNILVSASESPRVS